MSNNNDWDIIDNTNNITEIISKLYVKINELENKYNTLLEKYNSLKYKCDNMEHNYNKMCKNMLDIETHFKFLNRNKRSFLNDIMFPNTKLCENNNQ
jgi:hypothetical protein